MHEEFSPSFPDYIIFNCKFKADACFKFIKRLHFISWKNLKHYYYSMIMIIAIIYIIYVIFHQHLKITFRKFSYVTPSSPLFLPEKIHSTLFSHSPLKIQKVQDSSFLQTLKYFQTHC